MANSPTIPRIETNSVVGRWELLHPLDQTLAVRIRHYAYELIGGPQVCVAGALDARHGDAFPGTPSVLNLPFQMCVIRCYWIIVPHRRRPLVSVLEVIANIPNQLNNR